MCACSVCRSEKDEPHGDDEEERGQEVEQALHDLEGGDDAGGRDECENQQHSEHESESGGGEQQRLQTGEHGIEGDARVEVQPAGECFELRPVLRATCYMPRATRFKS